LTAISTRGYDGNEMKAKGGARRESTAEVPVVDSDRRRAPRVLVDLQVDYASEENYLFAYITDISETGIFVRTTTPEPPGTQLNLRFAPDGDGPQIEVEGLVIWVNPFRPGAPDNLHPGMGIRFVDLEDELRDRLLELVRRFAYLS
jgi:type IV pilus assembly protein PilZ